MMTCQEFVEFLMAYIDDELPQDTRAVFENHIVNCPPCGTYLDTYRDAIRLGRQAFGPCQGEEIAEDVPEALVKAVLEARRRGGKT